MKVLVTGGTGFTGYNLVKRLCKLGIEVRVLIRDKQKRIIFNGVDVEIIEGNITEPGIVDRAVEGIEKVFHIAAVFRTAGISEKEYWDVHVKGTENLLNSSIRYNIK